ncbi:MAG TPA: Hpt domain-containing protein [Candidatus Limnocylindrales bacterium]
MTDETPILDRSVVDELRDSVGGDEDFIADLVSTFVSEGRSHFAAMQAAADASDAAAIVRPAHTLKSSSAALGAMRLSAIAREIETAGRDGTTTGLDVRVTEARQVWEDTLKEMAGVGLIK